MKIDLIVFDLAGTTVKDNRDVHRVLQQAMKKHDVDISLDDANEVMGIPKPIAIRMLLEQRYDGGRHIDDEWITEIHKDFVKEMIHFYQTDVDVKEIEGVTQLFKELKESKLKVFVDTGFDRQITDVLLRRLGWVDGGLIDGSVTSDEVANGRPHPDLIYKAMALAGVTDVKRVAKVGDTPADLQEGYAAGCGLVVGVASGAFSRAALLEQPHTHVVNSAANVLELIK